MSNIVQAGPWWRRVRRATRWTVSLTLLALWASSALAQPPLFPTFTARVGGFVLDAGTTIELDAPTGRPGVGIDFEKEFGVDGNVSIGEVGVEWFPFAHHMFRANYYRSSRDGGRTLDGGFDLGGVHYPVGAQATAEVTTTTYELDWTWWLFKQERFGFGATLGATVLDLAARADATLQVGNRVREFHESASATAPVPTLGVEARGAIVPRVTLQGYIRLLPNITFDQISGDALQFHAAAEWMPFDRFGLGVSYHRFEVDADVDATHYQGALDLTHTGWQLYGRFSW